MKKIIGLLFVCLFLTTSLSAKEGMWIPTLLKKYNIEEMQKMGFKLTAEDIYDVNHASMKDAVVIFGGGCTGEMISNEGLLITNHHCGYGAIQSHSSLEHDYLTNGFWAMNRAEELPNPGLSVKFLVRMDDVTSAVFEGTEELDEAKRKEKIAQNIKQIEEDQIKDTHYTSIVKPIFYGNQYFIYIYEEFTDVRLVGAPPSAIGKFGGDTDNWMWPRHTGDFSMFRVYADKDGKPAEYSENNIPLKPKKFFPINLKGIEKDDFTMVFGYPGTTQEYLPSQAVDQIINQSDPEKVAIRTAKLSILAKDMEADRGVRIQYASKYARTANAWKKWQGEIKGLVRLDAINVKKAQETEFSKWVNSTPENNAKYGDVLSNFEKLYAEQRPYTHAADYFIETIYRGTDLFGMAREITMLKRIYESKDEARIEAHKNRILDELDTFYKNYNPATDEKVFNALLNMYAEDVDAQFLPVDFLKYKSIIGTEKFLDKVYRKSIILNQEAFEAAIKNLDDKSIAKLSKDPAISLMSSLYAKYGETIYPKHQDISEQILANQKLFMAGIMEMKEGQRLMADANFTLRVGYGKVEGFEPRDGVKYNYFTTLEGIMEKDNPEIYDYNVPQALRNLYKSKDYGMYANKEGKLPVAFCASNHTTGGNSGSPVVDAEGQLIGVNFDRCWEGTMSDIMFDPERCRNIALDIRYALFIVDKFAGAGYLLEEMDIVR